VVTNKKKCQINNQACLKLFIWHFFFQSGALRERRSQSLGNVKIICLLEIIYLAFLFSKRSFAGKTKSIPREWENYLLA
jgi:hypothetical protein